MSLSCRDGPGLLEQKPGEHKLRLHPSQMEAVEELLAANEDTLSIPELERLVVLLSDAVQSHREQLHQAKCELKSLEAETAERSRSRDSFASMLAQTSDLQEALEEEEKTRQELQETRDELERPSGAPQLHSSELLESRLKQTEDLVAAYQEEERKLLEETQSLQRVLKISQESLAQSSSENQRVAKELLALQRSLSDQRCPVPGTTDQFIDSCIKQMGLLNVLPDKKRGKK